MTAKRIGISYTPSGGGTAFNVLIDNFGDNAYPRTYTNSATFDLSANGTNIMGGPAFRQKYQWVISSIVTNEQAQDVDAMFQAWDSDRAQGLAAAVGITDQTFGADVDTDAVFVSAPVFTRMGVKLTMVSFGLQEV